jgi:outer membrane protein assembly factor BamB
MLRTRHSLAARCALVAFVAAACGDATSTSNERDLDVRWQVGAFALAAPIIADSLVIIRTANGDLVALRRSNGGVAWQGSGVEFNFTAALRRSGNVILVAHELLTAVDARDGRLLWERDDPGEANGVHSPAVLGGTVFGVELHAATAIDAITGNVLWQVERLGEAFFAPQAGHGVVVYHTRGFVAAGEPLTGGEIVALDAVTGQLRWAHKIHREASENPVVAGVAILADRVVAATLDGGMIALALDDGELLWEIPEVAEPPHGYLHAPTEFAGNVVFLRTDGALEARSPTNGAVAWETELPSLVGFNTGPVVCGVSLCHGSGALTVLGADGAVLWSSDDHSNLTFVSAPAADADGVLYVGAAASQSDARVMAVRPNVTVGSSLRR